MTGKIRSAVPIKRTAVERQVNVQILFLFFLLLALSIGSTIGSSIRSWFFSSQQWYLFEQTSLSGRGEHKRLESRPNLLTISNAALGFIEGWSSFCYHCSVTKCSIDILTFIILYNNLIPISLIVTMEVVKFQQAQFINSDLDMYYAKTDTAAICRTSSLVEELGQIEYVFSDKTGTLTCNEMEFRCCSIGGVAYADLVEESKREGTDGKDGWKTLEEMKKLLGNNPNPFLDSSSSNTMDEESKQRETIVEFLTLLAVCHTVIPEIKNEKMVYQASSPDEAALVAGAELLGFQFHVRSNICSSAMQLND